MLTAKNRTSPPQLTPISSNFVFIIPPALLWLPYSGPPPDAPPLSSRGVASEQGELAGSSDSTPPPSSEPGEVAQALGQRAMGQALVSLPGFRSSQPASRCPCQTVFMVIVTQNYCFSRCHLDLCATISGMHSQKCAYKRDEGMLCMGKPAAQEHLSDACHISAPPPHR